MITERQIEIFLIAANSGSFRKCAEKLGITQVSVSEQIRALETNLRVELFFRSKGSPPTLTEAGERARDTAPELLFHLRDFREVVSGISGTEAPIRIEMYAFLMRNLGQFADNWNHQQDRKIILKNSNNDTENLYHRTQSGDIDAAYFYCLHEPEFESDLVSYEPLGIFVSETHPLATKKQVTADDISATSRIAISSSDPLHNLIDEALLSTGVKLLSPIVETDSFGLILSSLHRNLGFACMLRQLLNESKQTYGLKEIKYERDLPPLQIRCIKRQGAWRSPSLITVTQKINNLIDTPDTGVKPS